MTEVEVGFDGGRLLKAFHDPDTGSLDLVVEGDTDAGEVVTFGEGLALSLDPEGMVVHLSSQVAALEGDDEAPRRPADARQAVAAGVALQTDAACAGIFDRTEGTLRVRFEGVEPAHWARLGENLVWLAIDDETRLAAIVVEGVSRDPGGRAQAAWLAEMNAGE